MTKEYFEKLQEICQYRNCVGMCTYRADDKMIFTCGESSCPFIKVINTPHRIPLNKYMTDTPFGGREKEKFKLKLPHYDESSNQVHELIHTVRVKFNALVDDCIMQSVRQIVDDHFINEITIDKEKVVDAFSKYQKKKVICNVAILETQSYNIHNFICPTCHGVVAKILSKYDKPGTLRGYKAKNYCSECGQHLDWEVEK